MPVLWTLVGILAGLLIAFIVNWARRRSQARSQTRLEQESVPGDGDDASSSNTVPADPAFDEAIWALRSTEQRLRQSDAQRTSMKARLEEAERHAIAREAALDDLRDEITGLTESAIALQRERDDAETAASILETELEAARAGRVEEDAARESEQVAGARRRAEALERAIVSARARAEGAIRELEAQRRRADAATTKADDTEALLESTRQHLDARTQVALELEAERDKLRDQHAELISRAAALQADLDQAALDHRETLALLGEARAAITQIDERAAEAVGLADDLRSNIESLERDRTALRNALQESEQETYRLQTALRGLARADSDGRTARQSDDAARARLADLERQLATVEAARRGEVSRLSAEVERLRRSAVVSDARAERIEELEASLRDSQLARSAAEATAETLMVRSTHLEQRLRAGADELRELDALSERFERVRASLATAREALAAIAGRDAADEIERLREALRAERDRTFRLSARMRDGSAAPDDPEGLRTRIRELEELISRIAVQGPDDLTLVRGIGPAIRDLLVSEGITTFAALAAIDEDTLDRIRAAVPVYPERIERDRWIEQAAALARRRPIGLAKG